MVLQFVLATECEHIRAATRVRSRLKCMGFGHQHIQYDEMANSAFKNYTLAAACENDRTSKNQCLTETKVSSDQNLLNSAVCGFRGSGIGNLRNADIRNGNGNTVRASCAQTCGCPCNCKRRTRNKGVIRQDAQPLGHAVRSVSLGRFVSSIDP